jgi:hypothetical protein
VLNTHKTQTGATTTPTHQIYQNHGLNQQIHTKTTTQTKKQTKTTKKQQQLLHQQQTHT